MEYLLLCVMITKLIITGYFILTLAIISNILAMYFDMSTWYTFLKDISEKGLTTTIYSKNVFDIIWLFLIYPIILAIGYAIGEKVCDFLI